MSTVADRRSRGQVPIQIWVPAQLAQKLDARLSAQITGLSGAKTSRQMFLIDLIRQALSDAASPAELYAAEPSAVPGGGPTATV